MEMDDRSTTTPAPPPDDPWLDERLERLGKEDVQPGAAALALMLAATVVWMGLGIWLSWKIRWPQSYGYRCSGNGCLFVDAWHSTALLHHPNLYALALFAWYWAMILVVGVLVVRAAVRRSGRQLLLLIALIVIGVAARLSAN